jgi:hypothetical protein
MKEVEREKQKGTANSNHFSEFIRGKSPLTPEPDDFSVVSSNHFPSRDTASCQYENIVHSSLALVKILPAS